MGEEVERKNRWWGGLLPLHLSGTFTSLVGKDVLALYSMPHVGKICNTISSSIALFFSFFQLKTVETKLTENLWERVHAERRIRANLALRWLFLQISPQMMLRNRSK